MWHVDTAIKLKTRLIRKEKQLASKAFFVSRVQNEILLVNINAYSNKTKMFACKMFTYSFHSDDCHRLKHDEMKNVESCNSSN